MFNTLDDVGCRGNEINLDDCTHRGVGVHDCNRGEEAGVICPPQGTVALMLYVTPLSPSYECAEPYECWPLSLSMRHGVTCFNFA